MKITKRQLKRIIKEERAQLIKEMNPDGTISDDEDEARLDLLATVEVQIDELVQYIKDEADRIGGIRKEAYRLMADKIHRLR